MKTPDIVERLRATGFAVTALEWLSPSNGRDTLERAETGIGVFRVWTHHEANGWWFWSFDGYERVSAEVDSCEAAKAAAQADYECRILSALAASSPQPVAEPLQQPELWHILADAARNLLARPPALRGPFKTDEGVLRRVAALPPRAIKPTNNVRELVAALPPQPTEAVSDAKVEATELGKRAIIGWKWKSADGYWCYEHSPQKPHLLPFARPSLEPIYDKAPAPTLTDTPAQGLGEAIEALSYQRVFDALS